MKMKQVDTGMEGLHPTSCLTPSSAGNLYTWQFPYIGGPQHFQINTTVLTMGTPRKLAVILGNPNPPTLTPKPSTYIPPTIPSKVPPNFGKTPHLLVADDKPAGRALSALSLRRGLRFGFWV